MNTELLNKINNAQQIIEVLAAKGGQDGMFSKIKDGFEALSQVNSDLQNQLESTKDVVDFILLNNPPAL